MRTQLLSKGSSSREKAGLPRKSISVCILLPVPVLVAPTISRTMKSKLVLKIWCVVLQEGSVFRVKVGGSQYVDDLKLAIKQRMPNTVRCDAPKLALYLAQRDDTWLKQDDLDLQQLARTPQRIPLGIQSLLRSETELRAGHRLDQFGFPISSPRDVVELHVLVDLPVHLRPIAASSSRHASLAGWTLFVYRVTLVVALVLLFCPRPSGKRTQRWERSLPWLFLGAVAILGVQISTLKRELTQWEQQMAKKRDVRLGYGHK